MQQLSGDYFFLHTLLMERTSSSDPPLRHIFLPLATASLSGLGRGGLHNQKASSPTQNGHESSTLQRLQRQNFLQQVTQTVWSDINCRDVPEGCITCSKGPYQQGSEGARVTTILAKEDEIDERNQEETLIIFGNDIKLKQGGDRNDQEEHIKPQLSLVNLCSIVWVLNVPKYKYIRLKIYLIKI
jgi:hypothetical protein